MARLAQRMGIRTKLSTNPAMLLGGLKEGVTPLEMAYAYSTIANDGKRISGSSRRRSAARWRSRASRTATGRSPRTSTVEKQVLPPKVAQVEKDMLALVVVSAGTGKAAQVGDEDIWGKTGTTENYGDAWFVGGNDDMTVAIWVGYADKLQPMEYEHAGGPVAGGTFPAEIFHDFMTSWLELRAGAPPRARGEQAGGRHRDRRGARPADRADRSAAGRATTPVEPDTGGATQGDGGGGTGGGGGQNQAPPQDQQPAEPAPAPARAADAPAHRRRWRRRDPRYRLARR